MYEGSNFQHHCHLSLLSLFLIVAILVGMNSYLIVVLICISLMAKDAEIFFLVLTGHLYIFFGEMSNQTFGPFLKWAIYVFIIENLRILYILWRSPYQMYDLQIFFPIWWVVLSFYW